MSSDGPVLHLEGVRVWTPGGVEILRGIDWRVMPGEHWAVLGPNGAGKSTLLSIVGATRHPSAGRAELLGGRFGQTDLRALRTRIGAIDPLGRLPLWLSAEVAVLTGISGTIQPHLAQYTADDYLRARRALATLGCADLAERPLRTCSHGERQRIRIARALVAEPALLLLDEPATGLDLPAREALLAALESMAARHAALASVLVSHHLEEIPTSTTHAMLLRAGATVATGAITEVLITEAVSECFGMPIEIEHRDGRWFARAPSGWATRSVPVASHTTRVPAADGYEWFEEE